MYETLLNTEEQKVTWILISIYCLNMLQELLHFFRNQAPVCTSNKGQQSVDAVLSHINSVLLHGLHDYKITKKYLGFEFACQKISGIQCKPTRETYKLKKKSLGTIKRFCLPGEAAENTDIGFCKMLTGYQILCSGNFQVLSTF